MFGGYVIDQFHDNYSFPHPGIAKRSDVASFDKWTDRIDGLDTSLQNL
jgi:hypothetical protein